MSFRMKTMLLIGLTEGFFLLLLLWQSLDYLEHSGEEALYTRAYETTHLFSLLTKKSVISSDLAALTEMTRQISNLKDVKYIRVVDSIGVLAQAGDVKSLDRNFIEDFRVEQVNDGVFDTQTLITISGVEFASVQVGLSIEPLLSFNSKAQTRLVGIALTELFMVALVSLILGRYLTTGLLALQKVALSITKGDMSSRVVDLSKDELGITAKAFNVMLDKIDVDQKKLNESAVNLTKAKQTAENASQAKSRFLSQMSHEIRSPLNAVLGAVNLVAEKTTKPPEHIRLLKTAQSSGIALLGVVNEILDFSKIEAGHMELSYGEINLLNLVEDVLNSAEAKIVSPKLTIIGDIAPDCSGDIITDGGCLRQILNILVDNACKFTSEGTVIVTVQRTQLEDNTCVLQVYIKDSGIGIKEEYLDTIFKEFEQVDSTLEAKFSGTGLGLNIAKGLVDLMEGSIGVDSMPGHGSNFYFSIPVSFINEDLPEKPKVDGPLVFVSDNQSLLTFFSNKAQDMNVEFFSFDDIHMLRKQNIKTLLSKTAICIIDDSVTVNDSNGAWLQSLDKNFNINCISRFGVNLPLALTGFNRINRPVFCHELCSLSLQRSDIQDKKEALIDDSRHDNKKILLVDDIEANRFIGGETLKNRGFNVSFASNGIEALEILSTQNFDVVLMDVRMPIMNGIVAVETLRQSVGINQNTPVIAMTANAEKSEMSRCEAAGMNDFVSKPFDTQRLIDSINRCIDSRQDKVSSSLTSSHTSTSNKDEFLSEIVLTNLAEDTSKDSLIILIGIFIAEIEERTQLLKKALAEVDYEGLYEHAHALKSSAGSLGAQAMYTFCIELEQASSIKNLSNVNDICKQLTFIAEQTHKTYDDFMLQYAIGS